MRSPLKASDLRDEKDYDAFLADQVKLKAEYEKAQEQKRLEAVKDAEASAKIKIEQEQVAAARSSKLLALKKQIDYTDKLGIEICRRVASGEVLKAICEEQTMPPISSILEWIEDADKTDFKRNYIRATKFRDLVFEDEIVMIADDSSNDYIDKKNTKSGEDFRVLDPEALTRSKLRIDTRLKILRANNPARWGDNPNAAEAAAALQRNQSPKVLIQFITPANDMAKANDDKVKIIENQPWLKIDIEERLRQERKIG